MKSLVIIAAFLCSAFTLAAAEIPLSVVRDKEIVDTFARMPVQEAGRIKPLDTLARYRLLRFSGKRTIGYQNPESNKKETLSSIEWLLVSWFRPDIAKALPVFVIDNSDAIAELGLSIEGKNRRDRYSFNEIAPARSTLMEKMREYGEIDAKKRSPAQRILSDLGVNFLDYEMVLGHFDFIRHPVGEQMESLPAELKQQDAPLRMSKLLPQVVSYIKTHSEAAAPMQNPWLFEILKGRFGALMSGNPELTLRIFPPPLSQVEQWHGPGWIMGDAFEGKEVSEADWTWLALYEDLYLALPDAAKFKTAVQTLAAKTKGLAAERGEGRFVDLEVSYLKADYFYYALIFFLLGLIMLSITWAKPVRWLKWIATLSLLAGTGLAVTGIVIRCVIMQRPPVTTLYETILFISATAALFGLIAEWITRKNLGLLIAAMAGTAGMFLSIRFESMEGQDTMQQLQAVLITNFWLATHVPIINLGYSAGMVAAILGMVYMIRRLIGSLKAGDDSARSLTRMGYGFDGAALFLSLIGTVLGGIWANYSWGRFWGWDPKENGALMIVLMSLIILHARLGGYIRELGLHLCNIVLGMIVVFSWFATNQLGVGLHAYGFTDGVWRWLYIFWSSQVALLLLGVWFAWQDRQRRRATA